MYLSGSGKEVLQAVQSTQLRTLYRKKIMGTFIANAVMAGIAITNELVGVAPSELSIAAITVVNVILRYISHKLKVR